MILRSPLGWFLVTVIAAAAEISLAQDIPGLPDPPPVWGDVTRDRELDIRDLVQIGQDFETAQDDYSQSSEKIIERINSHWKDRVPLFLHELAWENKAQILSDSSSSLKQAGSGFYSLGFAVTFPTGINGDFERAQPGQRVFEVTDRRSSTFGSAAIGGYSESNDDNRYSTPIVDETTDVQYMHSIADEYDFLGFDLNLEARYALYSGGLRSSFRSERYSNNTVHTLMFKVTKDFGWFYQPTDSIVLTEAFQNALDSIDENRVKRDFGTHYVFAERKVAELYIKVTFNTLTEQNRREFGAEVNASYDNIGTAVDFFSAMASIRERINGVTSLNVSIERRGGDSVILLGDNSEWTGSWSTGDLLAASAEEQGSLLNEVSQRVSAWSKNVSEDNTVPSDYIVRPISDFYPDPDSNPLSKEASLRRWLRAYLEFDGQIEALREIAFLELGEYSLGESYEHFELANESNGNEPPAGRDSWLQYFVDVRELTEQRYANLLEIGREIYASTEENPVLFDTNLPEQNERYGLPRYRTPIIEFSLISDDGSGCDPVNGLYYIIRFTTPWVEMFPLIGTNRESGRYRVAYGLDNDVLPFELQYQSTPVSTARVDIDPPVNERLRGYIQIYGEGIGSCTAFNNWAANPTGLFLGVLDQRTNKIISYVCVAQGECLGNPGVLGEAAAGL